MTLSLASVAAGVGLTAYGAYKYQKADQADNRQNRIALTCMAVGILAIAIGVKSIYFGEAPSVKWELAERLTEKSNAPTEALEALFKGMMDELKVEDQSIRERVWNVVSPEKLKILKDTLTSEVSDKILNFDEKTLSNLLRQHKMTGSIAFPSSLLIERPYYEHREAITNAVVKQAKSMSNTLVPQIVEVLKNLTNQTVEFA